MASTQGDIVGPKKLEAVGLLERLAQQAVAAYPAFSLSIAYIDGSSVSCMHHSGALMPTPDDTSIYEIGSITKTFTGALLAAAVAWKHVSLDTPVKSVVKKLQGTVFPEGITLLSLATHTSGLPREDPNMAATSKDTPHLGPFAKYTEQHMISFLSSYSKPPPAPGPAAFLYSNLGVGLLGYTLEQVLGQPYEQLVATFITGPGALGMPDTVSFLTDEQSGRRVPGYFKRRDAEFQVSRAKLQSLGVKEIGDHYEVPEWQWEGVPIRACGCLKSTLADMAIYACAALQRTDELAHRCPEHEKEDSSGGSTASLPMQLGGCEDVCTRDLIGHAQQRQCSRRMVLPVQERDEDHVVKLLAKSSGTYGYIYMMLRVSWVTLACTLSQLSSTLKSWWSSADSRTGPKSESKGPSVGLNWMIDDLSASSSAPRPSSSEASDATPYMRWHLGRTYSSNSAMFLHANCKQGVVLLSKYSMDFATGFSPDQLILPIARMWAVAAARDENKSR